MLICTPIFAQFINKLPIPATNLELANCGNYTAGMLEWTTRRTEWKYMWNIFKYRMTSMFVLAGVVSIAGILGETNIGHGISMRLRNVSN